MNVYVFPTVNIPAGLPDGFAVFYDGIPLIEILKGEFVARGYMRHERDDCSPSMNFQADNGAFLEVSDCGGHTIFRVEHNGFGLTGHLIFCLPLPGGYRHYEAARGKYGDCGLRI